MNRERLLSEEILKTRPSVELGQRVNFGHERFTVTRVFYKRGEWYISGNRKAYCSASITAPAEDFTWRVRLSDDGSDS